MPIVELAQGHLNILECPATLHSFLRKPMRILCTRQNKDGSYDEVGMNNRFLTSNYKTTNGFLRYGIPTHFYGNNIRLEVYYGDNVFRDPDKVLYVTV